MAKKIFLCEFHEESNSFNPLPLQKEEMSITDISSVNGFSALANKKNMTGGVADLFSGTEYKYCGGFRATVHSAGPLSDKAVKWFTDDTVLRIKTARPDGVVMCFHGATVSETSDDVCGDIIEAVRAAAGEKAVISAGFDLHANITDKIKKNADFVCGYQTYPHIDHYNTGKRAAQFTKRALEGEKLKTAYAAVPVIAPAQSYTTVSGGLKALHEKAAALVQKGEISDFTVFQAQPWLDVPEIGSVIAVIGRVK